MDTLQRFMGSSVSSLTMAGYRREWKTWTEFVQRKCRGGDPDPYLEKQEDRVKVLMVCHLLAERKEAGKREKAATSITAAIRKHFATALLNTEWLNSEAIAVARKACRRTPHENREYMRAGQGRARLPVWLSLLGRLREKLWEGRGFGWEDIDSKMTYVTAMYGFDVAARAGEATSNGGAVSLYCAETSSCSDGRRSVRQSNQRREYPYGGESGDSERQDVGGVCPHSQGGHHQHDQND